MTGEGGRPDDTRYAVYLCEHCKKWVTWSNQLGEWAHYDHMPLCIWAERVPLRKRFQYCYWRAPFPRLFNRWEVRDSNGYCADFWRKSSAELYVKSYEECAEAFRSGRESSNVQPGS